MQNKANFCISSFMTSKYVGYFKVAVKKNKANPFDRLRIQDYNKLTGSISIAIFTAGRTGGSARRLVNNRCVVAACGA